MLHIGFDKMSQIGHISAVNLTGQINVMNFWNPQSTWRCGCHHNSRKINALSFRGSDFMGHRFKIHDPHSVGSRPRKGMRPLQVFFINLIGLSGFHKIVANLLCN